MEGNILKTKKEERDDVSTGNRRKTERMKKTESTEIMKEEVFVPCAFSY